MKAARTGWGRGCGGTGLTLATLCLGFYHSASLPSHPGGPGNHMPQQHLTLGLKAGPEASGTDRTLLKFGAQQGGPWRRVSREWSRESSPDLTLSSVNEQGPSLTQGLSPNLFLLHVVNIQSAQTATIVSADFQSSAGKGIYMTKRDEPAISTQPRGENEP